MTRDTRLAALAGLAGMLRDRRLADLRAAALARAATQARLAALAAGPAPDLPPLVAAQQALRHQVWADAQRARINLVLARETAAWIAARDSARSAFGRAEVLRRLAETPK